MARTEVRNGGRSLVEAIENDDVGALQRAVTAGARVSGRVLIYAVMLGRYASVAWLLEAGVNPNALGSELYEHLAGYTTVTMAAEQGHEMVLYELIMAGAYVNVTDRHGFTPMMLAARDDYVGCLEQLIKAGADVNYRGPGGQTALIRAAHCGSRGCVELLVQAGAELNIADGNGMTALMVACWKHKFAHYGKSASERREIVEILLKGGANVHIRDSNHDTAMVLACEQTLFDWYPGEWNMEESCRVIEVLLVAGANVNIAGCLGITPLMQVCRYQTCDGHRMAVMLLNAGGDINACDELLTTPLMYAVEYNGINMLALLLNRGADVNMVNCDGKTAVQLVSRGDNDVAVIKVLMYAGADMAGVDLQGCDVLREAWESCNELKKNLKHRCREVIRKSVMMQNPGKALDWLVQRLGLPIMLRDYVADVNRYHE